MQGLLVSVWWFGFITEMYECMSVEQQQRGTCVCVCGVNRVTPSIYQKRWVESFLKLFALPGSGASANPRLHRACSNFGDSEL